MSKNLSVVIPVYNAQDILKQSFNQLIKVLETLKLDYEVLFRNDGSTDESRHILEAMAKQNTNVHIAFNDGNDGLGLTLRRLFEDADGDYIVYCDCDFPYGVAIIPEIVRELKGSEIVVASRYRGIRSRIPLSRWIVSRGYHIFCRWLFNIPVIDIGSGSVGLRKEVLAAVDLGCAGFGIHAELFVKAARKGISIKEIPAQAYFSNAGSFRILKHGPNIIRETVQLWGELVTSEKENKEVVRIGS